MPVSETEKHGVSTSASRFKDKVENIPIKKRRFLFRRSPSPPPVRTFPCAEETADHKCIKDSDKPDDRLGEDEDFSGISILAAAACSSSLGRDCGYAEDALVVEESSELDRRHEASTTNVVHVSSKGLSKEDVLNSSEMSSGATSSCISTEPVGELASISTTVNSSQKVATIEKILEEAPLGADSLTLSRDVSCTKEERSRSPRVPSQDERLRWDLNVVMDAWEQPFDDSHAQDGVSHNRLEEPCVGDHSDSVKTGGHDLQYNLETVCDLKISERCLLPGESRSMTSQGKENLNIELSPGLHDKALSSSSNHNFDVMNYSVEEAKVKPHEETVNPNNGLVVPVPDGMVQVSASNMIESVGASVVDRFKSNPVVPSCDLQNHGNAVADSTNTDISLCVSSCPDTLVERKPNVVSEGLEPPKILHREGNDLKMVEPQEPTELSISNDHGHPDTQAPKSMPKRFLMTGTDAAGEFQEGYDSQYEDGELRESSGRAWEEYGRDAENADYVYECKESYNVDPSDYHASYSGQVVDRKSGNLGVGRDVSFDVSNADHDVYERAVDAAGNDRGHDEGNPLKLSHVGEKTEELLKEKPVSSKSFSDMATRDADDIGGKDKMPSHRIDRYLESGGSESRTEPKKFRSLQSQVEGPIERDDIYRDDQVKKINNRFDSGSMRSFERLRYSFHNQVGGRQGTSWGGSSDVRRGFRRHYSPIFRGNRKLKLDEDADVDRDEIGCIDMPDNALYSQQLERSGAEVESCAGFNSRFKCDRKFSPDRVGGFGRGGSFRCGPFADSRGGRGRYNVPSSDERFQSSLKYRLPLSRRERSLSPLRRRGQSNSNIYHSRRKSPSRSRSRSPITWNSPRGRLGAGSSGGISFFRNRSRSPNFRSEARMQRLRSPHQQPGFGVDQAGGFRPISRNGSPPRRWTSARKDEMGQFREIGYKQRTPALDRSPGRIRLRGDRGSDVDSPRSLKADGFYRMSDRIPDDAGRGFRYEENYEDRRKQYNPFCPTRRNFDDDLNDGFSMPNRFRNRDASSFQDRGFRSINNRLSDVPKRFRGENRSFIYERDVMHDNNSKQFGLDGMDSSLNLKSNEQYRSNYAGRFSDVNGTNRGSRYENYEDRRKHYSATNIIRHSNSEDSENTINDDENFKDTSGRGAKRFDGRIGSLSTRFRENEEPVMAGQEKKLDDNPQPVVLSSGEIDATRAITS